MKVCNNKNCTHGGVPQSKSNFHKKKNSKDGLYYECKDCVKERNRIYKSEHKEELRERDKLRTEYFKQHSTEWKKQSAKYNQYSNLLNIFEECRRNPEDLELLQVRCFHSSCTEWFTPTNREVQHRLAAFNGQKSGEHHFYCSDKCKSNCAVYNKRSDKIKIDYDREVQPELKELVLERDAYKCIKCGNTENLICHHIDPVINNPIESADIDNCIIVCICCHYELHQIDGCKLNQLKC